MIKAKRGPEYKDFSHENGLTFSEKIGIFQKYCSVSLINGVQFLRGAFKAAFP